MKPEKMDQAEKENKKISTPFIASSLIIAGVIAVVSGYTSTFAKTAEVTALDRRLIITETNYNHIIDKMDTLNTSMDELKLLLGPNTKRPIWHKKQPR